MGEVLVSRECLEKIVDSIKALEPYRTFLKGRWIGMVMWWHERSVEARGKYIRLRRMIIFGSVSIPVLSAFGLHAGWEHYASLATACVGAGLAGCAAWEGLNNYGEVWREKRRAAELLKVEGFQFFQLCGKYESPGSHDEKTYRLFAAEVEKMIAKEVGEYLEVFDASIKQAERDRAAAVAVSLAAKEKQGDTTKGDAMLRAADGVNGVEPQDARPLVVQKEESTSVHKS